MTKNATIKKRMKSLKKTKYFFIGLIRPRDDDLLIIAVINF